MDIVTQNYTEITYMNSINKPFNFDLILSHEQSLKEFEATIEDLSKKVINV